MGTGKKKIEMKKITNEKSRMESFSKRKKGLFKKAKEIESMTGSRVASIVFSPTGRIFTCGDVESAIERHFSSSSCTKLSTLGMNSHDVVGVVSGGSSSTSKRNGLRVWVEGIDVEECQDLNNLLMLKKQLEGTRKKIVSSEDADSFEALFA